eukprot:3308154-Pleurochrysis_carterae.AAC.1
MAERGERVLALASKAVTDVTTDADAAAKPRDWAERDLDFAGFVAFACKTRSDSPFVIKALTESAHRARQKRPRRAPRRFCIT